MMYIVVLVVLPFFNISKTALMLSALLLLYVIWRQMAITFCYSAGLACDFIHF